MSEIDRSLAEQAPAFGPVRRPWETPTLTKVDVADHTLAGTSPGSDTAEAPLSG